MSSAVRIATSSVYVRWLAGVASALGLAACGGQSVTPNGGGQPPPPPTTYTLGGTISGLVANGLVLTSNGQSVTVNSGTSTFSFATALASGTAYAVTVQTTPDGLTCSVANGSGTIGTANVSNVVVTCSDKAYTVGGSITGLSTSGLILGNGSDQLTVTANARSFMMPTPVAFTSTYQVKVVAQPQGLTCSVQNGTGTMGTAAVTNVAVSCSNQLFKIGGTVSGLTVSGLVLTNNSGDSLNVPANAATFTFATAVAFGSTYSVAVASQPAGLTCSVNAGSGAVPAADVTSVQIVCSNQSYFLGGSVSGLAYSGLVLSDGTDSLAVPLNATGFTMPTKLAFMSNYTVTVATQPTNGLCSVSNASGTMPAHDVTDVAVMCAARLYTLGGTISGLSATGLILANGTDRLSVAANAAQFSMPTGLAYNSTYNVTVVSQPPGLTCTVTNGSGTMPGNDFNGVTVSCAARLWTWKKESNVAFAAGVYGTKGVPDVNNLPGSRDNQMTWTDSNGHFWMFGGAIVDGGGLAGDVSDLWSYDPGTSTWTWVAGPNTENDPGSYGSLGVAQSSNQPPARHGATTWADSSGNLWMFGGATAANVFFNDVWMFDTTHNLWKWVAGPSTQTSADVSSVYGTKGMADPTNRPHARSNAVSWVDSAGHLWMLGGLFVDTSAVPNVNDTFSDLWSFDTTSNEWTWVSGSNAMNNPGQYGSQGVGNIANSPPTRFGAASWLEASTGKLWLFGGGNFLGGAVANALNDVWTYNPADGKWTWVTGSNTPNAYGTYGTQGIAAAGNQPGGRGGATAWADNQGHFWIFGGLGLDVGPSSGGSSTADSLNDLWSLDPTTGQWTWVGGAQKVDQGGVYGTLGVAASGNIPGARSAAAGWVDSTGSLWLFGGAGYDSATPTPAFGDLNDVWKF